MRASDEVEEWVRLMDVKFNVLHKSMTLRTGSNMLKRTVNFILRREECKNIPVRVHIICEGQVLPPPQKFEQQAETCKEKKAQERQRGQKDCTISKLIWMLKIMMKYTLINF